MLCFCLFYFVVVILRNPNVRKKLSEMTGIFRVDRGPGNETRLTQFEVSGKKTTVNLYYQIPCVCYTLPSS